MAAAAAAIFAILWSIPQTLPVTQTVAPLVGGFILGPGTGSCLIDREWIASWGGHERYARRKIVVFCGDITTGACAYTARRPVLVSWCCIVFFDPREPEIKACFDALGVDPMYARKCFNQNCFRARISPKPRRIGLPRLRSPYFAAWRPEHADLPARREWIAAYETRAEAYAACRHVETLGSAHADPAAEAVQHLHDAFCRADQNLRIA